MRKKIIPVIFLVLLLFAGIIALTQESDSFDPGLVTEPAVREEAENSNVAGDFFSRSYESAREIPEWVRPARWFRSNAGGMALEEIPSQFAALRNEYALVIDFIGAEELPEYLFPYYDNSFFIEIRRLYEHGEETRVQRIFRDKDGTTRLIAVFIEPESSEVVNNDNEDAVDGNDKNDEKKRSGFIEIFDEKALINSEFRFYDDGEINKINYNYKDGYIISADFFLWEENDEGGEFTETHTDFFRYNRSSFLRAMERVFLKDRQISPPDDAIKIAFPSNILNAAKDDYFMSEKLNPYPDFFGDIIINKDSRIVFTTDERGRVLTQMLYDDQEEDKIIWVIRNIWSGDRVVSTSKTEGGTELLAEYEYDSEGNRILERNIRNGVLERLVITEDNKDIERLYFNNIVILQTVWEDGRKISETRMSN